MLWRLVQCAGLAVMDDRAFGSLFVLSQLRAPDTVFCPTMSVAQLFILFVAAGRKPARFRLMILFRGSPAYAYDPNSQSPFPVFGRERPFTNRVVRIVV